MELEDAIKGRRSIRRFLDKAVEEEKLEKILDLIKWSPSAHNAQEWEIFVVKDEKRKGELADAAFGQSFLADAPVVLVVCGNKARLRGEHYLPIDMGIVTYNICLVAYSLGLGTCIVGAFDPDRVRKVLGVGDKLIPYSIIPIGYPSTNPKPPERRSDYVHFI